MAVIAAPKIVELSQSTDIKKALIKEVGDISKVEVLGENLFVAKYVRPEKTAGGIIRPADNIKEDEFQSNVGLVMKLGEELDEGVADELMHHWVLYGYNDGQNFHYNGVACKIISVDRIRAIIPDPTKVL